jgi:hypothetical protein
MLATAAIATISLYLSRPIAPALSARTTAEGIDADQMDAIADWPDE